MVTIPAAPSFCVATSLLVNLVTKLGITAMSIPASAISFVSTSFASLPLLFVSPAILSDWYLPGFAPLVAAGAGCWIVSSKAATPGEMSSSNIKVNTMTRKR